MVEFCKCFGGGGDLGADEGAAFEAEFVVGEGGVFVFGLEPAAGAFAGDDFGECFIEVSVTRFVVAMVGEFVKDEFGEVGFGVVDEGVEDGVVEPAESGVGVGGAEVGFVSLGLEFCDEFFSVFAFEEAPVVLFADDGVGPGFGFEGEFGSGVDDVGEVGTFEVGVVGVGAG